MPRKYKFKFGGIPGKGTVAIYLMCVVSQIELSVTLGECARMVADSAGCTIGELIFA